MENSEEKIGTLIESVQEVINETKGVLLIALGHSEYGRMAYNLAASLLNTAPDLKIHLVYTPSAIHHLNDGQKQMFTSMKEAPKELYINDGKFEFIKAKPAMYDLSPFDTTIFLDVDMVWLNKNSINKLFDELAELDYTCKNTGCIDLSADTLDSKYSQWADVNEIKSAYGIEEGRYYSLHSEFIYFVKSEANKLFFDEWQKQYAEMKVKHVTFAGGVPDELPLAIATIIHDKYPHKDNFVPVFWERNQKPLERSELIANYYGYSIGGNNMTPNQEQTYNDFVRHYMNKIGSRIVFTAASKKSYLTERQNF